MDRVAVVGCGGAGKSTFARELGRRTGLPVVHLDRIHWKPGWVETPAAAWAVVVEQAASADRWILDGNYGGTFGIRFERADTIVVLAPSRWRCLARVLRRTIRNYGRAVQADGCPERFEASFLRWVWRYPLDSRPRLDRALAAVDTSTSMIELRSPRDVREFLAAVDGGSDDDSPPAPSEDV